MARPGTPGSGLTVSFPQVRGYSGGGGGGGGRSGAGCDEVDWEWSSSQPGSAPPLPPVLKSDPVTVVLSARSGFTPSEHDMMLEGHMMM